MFNQETYDVFLNSFTPSSNGVDEFIIDVPSDVRNAVRRNFRVNSIDEEILLVRDTGFWNNRDQGLVITDWGVYVIPDNEDDNSFFSFSWEEVEEVKYKDEVLYFYDSNNQYSQIHSSYFLKNGLVSDTWAQVFHNMAQCQEAFDYDGCIQDFMDMVNNPEVSAEEVQNRGIELKNSGIFHEDYNALFLCRIAKKWKQVADDILLDDEANYESPDQQAALEDEANRNAIAFADAAETWLSEDTYGKFIGEIQYYRSLAQIDLGDNLGAMRQAINVLAKSTDEGDRSKLLEILDYKNTLEEYPERFVSYRGYGLFGDSKEEYRNRETQKLQKELKEAQDANDTELIENVKSEFEDLNDVLNSDRFFSNRPYQERQFIFVARDLNSIEGCYGTVKK